MADTTLKVLFQLQDQMSGPLSNISTALGQLQKLAVGVGAALGVAFGLRALVQLGKDAITAAEHITSLSRQTGISTTNIQKLGVASEAANVPMSQLSTAFRLLAEHIEMAASGNKRQIELFDKLGVSVRDSAGNIRATEDVFNDIADTMKKTENPTLRAALAIETFGRSGHLMLPMLQQGSAGIKAIGDEAEKTGLIMSRDVVASLNLMGREMQVLQTVLTNAAGTMLISLGDVIVKAAQAVASYAEVISITIGSTKLLFTYVVEGFKFVATAVYAAMQYAADAVTVFRLKGMEAFKDIIQGVIDLMDTLKLPVPEKFRQFAQGMNLMIAAAKTGLPDMTKSYEEMQAQISTAMKILDEDLAEFDSKNVNETSARTQKIKDEMNALLALFATMKKMNKEQSASSGEGVRDMAAMSASITGGLQLAMEDITKRTVDWRKAWTNMFDSMQTGISTALDTFILKGGKMKDLMKNIFESIEQSFVHMLTTMLTQAMLKEFLGLFMNTGGGGGAMGNSVASMDTRFGGSSLTGGGGGGGGGGGSGLGGMGGLFGGIMGTSLVGATYNDAQIVGVGADGVPIYQAGSMASSGLTVGGAMAGIGGTLAGLSMMNQAQSTSGGNRVNIGRSVGGGALSGMAMGATIGSIIPGIGTVIGGVVGALAGAVMGFTGGKSAKKKQQKAEEEAAAAQAEQEAALRAQARQLIMADIRAKYGGGLADVSAVSDIGAIMSGGISDATLDQFGGAANVMNQSGAIGQSINNIQVSSPITVNATLAGSYDTQVLAQDLGIQLAASIRAAASGAGI